VKKMAKAIIHNEWQEKLEKEFEAPYYRQLRAFLKEEYLNGTVYPGMQHIWEETTSSNVDVSSFFMSF